MYDIAVPVQSAGMEACGGREKILAELKRMGAKRIFLAMGTLCTDPAEREYEFAKLKENAAFFKSQGFEVGSWMWTFWIREKNTFVPMTGAGETNMDIFACPLDEDFRAFIKEYVKGVARCGVDIINFDDDFRYGYIGGKNICCTCHLHMKKICDLLGEELTPAQLEAKVLTGGKNKYRDAWLKVNGDALRDHARLIREAIDEVDPTIRGAICACMPSWDADGADSAELARILAGDTKPLIRLIGAPYWSVNKLYQNSRLQNVIDLERMERTWCKDGIEVYAEGDCYPRPRTTCPSSYLELFDMAMRVDGRLDGIMKYSIDYYSTAGYETGYIDAQIRNTPIYEAIDTHFANKNGVGVRVYEALNKLADMDIPRHIREKETVYDLFFSPASRLLADNSIPSVFDGDGLCGIAFGENVKYVPEAQLKKGIITDARGAMILSAMGIDTGYEDFGEEVHSSTEYFEAEGMYAGYVGDFISYRSTLKPGAEVISSLVLNAAKRSETDIRTPFTFRYQNADGARFFIINLEAYFCSDSILRGYARSRTVAEAAEWIGGAKLPAYSYGNPDLYIMCKESEDQKAVGLFNIFADGIYDSTVELGQTYTKATFINCEGKLCGDKAIIAKMEPFSFAGIALEK